MVKLPIVVLFFYFIYTTSLEGTDFDGWKQLMH